jgi:hypothetical protein
LDQAKEGWAMTGKREILATAFKLRALAAGLEAAVNTPSKGPKTPLEDTSPIAAWRAAHRVGTPSRITSDPEVEAFILARIEAMTYTQIVAAVAQSFPKSRHISMSSLQRWWAKRRAATS